MRIHSVPARRGFTLAELLVVVAIVGLLVAIAVPAVRGARDSGRTAASLSNLRQCTAVALAYTADYAGLFPLYTDPTLQTQTVLRHGGFALPVRHMAAESWWHLALADAYLAGAPFAGVAYSPHEPLYRPDDGYHFAHYVYTCSLQADPRFFDPETRWVEGIKQLRAVGVREVVQPSLRAVFTNRLSPVPDPNERRYEIGFVDGSAALVGPRGLGPQYEPNTGDWWPGKTLDFGHRRNFDHGLHTHLGARGRDVRTRNP